jgi:hypothetical protein
MCMILTGLVLEEKKTQLVVSFTPFGGGRFKIGERSSSSS